MADQATEVGVEIAKDVWRVAIAQIGKELGYLIHYRNNIDDLNKQVEALKAKSRGITLKVERARRNGDIIDPAVEQWHERVNELVEQVPQFLEEVAENKGCLHGWCPNVKKCRSLSKKAKKTTEEAAVLEIKQLEQISHPPPPPRVGDSYIGDYSVFDSRTPRLNEMMKLLGDDASHMICLCGIGGAGKTTMVHEIAIRAENEKLFDEVVEAVASQNHDKMKTQQEIARYLGLNFDENETTLKARADKLRRRLLQSKKGNLVIIDDVWESFDLKEIGIPCGREHKNCKVVLTSRSVGVCSLIECQCGMGECRKFVSLGVLTQKESWSLFTAKAGKSCYKQSLYQTASEIVEKCDGLPIALVTLGKALNGKTDDEWVETLEMMQKPTVLEDIGEMEKKVYLPLKASYDLLKNKEAKSLFLLCCLYPEDWIIYEDHLVYYTLGLDCFDGIDDSLSRARRKVRVLTEELKRCNLLLDGGGRTLSVKVHDVLRVVGNTIASSVEAKGDFPLSPAMVVHGEKWKERAVVEPCKALSVVSDEIKDFGSSRMDLRELEVLQLSCGSLSREAVSSMFEGMREIKVVIMWGMEIPSFSLSPLLKKIRVLVLDSKDTGGLITIKDLDNLVILRIRGYFEGVDLGNLTNLRLLDISGCVGDDGPLKLSTGFISQLQQLEELRAEPTGWGYNRGGGGGELASVAELESLTCLSYLGIKVNDIKDLSGTPFLGKLKRYAICVGAWNYLFSDSFSERKISLYIGDEGCTDLGGGVDRLIEESVEILYLKGDGMGVALKKIGSGSGGHRCLKKLFVESCDSEMVENLIADTGFEVVFPQLGVGPSSSTAVVSGNRKLVFPKLNKLRLRWLMKLKCFCQGGIELVEFPQLQSLQLADLPELVSFCPEDQTSVATQSNDNIDASLQPLFNSKVVFSCLEELELESLNRVAQLWSSCQFPKLKVLKIDNLSELVNVFPSGSHIRFPSLGLLETLWVMDCSQMVEIISNNEVVGPPSTSTAVVSENRKLVFPKLNKLSLQFLNNLKCFCQGGIERVEFPQLQTLRLWDLPKLVSFCPEDQTSVATQSNDNIDASLQPLFNSKVVFSCLEKLELRSLNRVAELWSSCQFSKLKVLKIGEISKLVNVFPSDLHIRFPCLEELFVEKCESMEIVFGCKEQTYENIKYIQVVKCRKLQKLCSAFTFNGFTNLRTLKVEDCGMEYIVRKEGEEKEGEGEDGISVDAQEVVTLNKLQTVELKQLESLKKCFCNAGYALAFPELTKVLIEDCPNLSTLPWIMIDTPKLKSASLDPVNTPNVDASLKHKQVVFSCLEKLELRSLNRVAELWGCCQFPKLKVLKIHGLSELVNMFPSDSHRRFPCLEELFVEECESMEIVFGCKEQTYENLKYIKVSRCPKLPKLCSAFTFKGFTNLRTLKVEDCGMEYIVRKEGEGKEGEGEDGISVDAQEVVTLNKIETVELKQLKSLRKCFYNAGYALGFPELTKVLIEDCPNLSTLSWSMTDTPKLKSASLDPINTPKVDDSLKHKKNDYSRLAHSQVDDVKELCYSLLPPGWFQKLRVLTVHRCDKFENLFPSHLQIDLPCLEKLDMQECRSMEIVFGSKGQKLENLKTIQVWNCPGLVKLCYASTFGSLSSLCKLEVYFCEKMEVVVAKEDEKEGERKDGISTADQEVVSLTRLQEILISYLPSLECFCDINYALELPELKKVMVFGCPELDTFSSSSVSTPKIGSVTLGPLHSGDRKGDEFWLGDLNKTIKQHKSRIIKGEEMRLSRGIRP